jgi:hypothetical protein
MSDITDDSGDRMYSQATQVNRGVRGASLQQPAAPVLSPAAPQEPVQAAQTPPAPAPAPVAPAEPVAPPAHDSADITAQVEALVSRPLSDGEAMSEQAMQPIDPVRHIAPTFDQLELQARETNNTDDQAALAEGRVAVTELLAEFAVPGEAARELVSTLTEANSRWMTGELPDDETFERQRQQGVEALRQEWGSEFNARCALATQAYRQALVKAPWLANLVEEVGAGNDPRLVKHFAEIGLRNARRARARK